MDKLSAVTSGFPSPPSRGPAPPRPEHEAPADRFQAGEPAASAELRLKRPGASKISTRGSDARELAMAGVPILGAAFVLLGKRLVGKKKDSFLSELRETAPRSMNRLGAYTLARLSGPVERDYGLSLNDLWEVRRFVDQQVLATRVTEAGGKQVAPVLTRLGREAAPGPLRGPAIQNLHPLPEGLVLAERTFGSFVYLGPERAAQAEELTQAFDQARFLPKDLNPYRGTELEGVWKAMSERAEQGRMAVFIDLDGDLRSDRPTEVMATATVASLTERMNTLGSEAADPRTYYRVLTDRIQTYYDSVEPWLQAERPTVHGYSQAVKAALAPSAQGWLARLRGEEDAAVTADPDEVKKAVELVSSVGRGASDQAVLDFADLAVSLDRDLYTGLQTHWMRLLRSADPEERERLFQPLARAWVRLNLADPDHPIFPHVSPAGGPIAEHHASNPLFRGQPRDGEFRYDRGRALGEVIDHTLCGLGVVERRQFQEVLKRQLAHHRVELANCDFELRQRLPGYEIDTDLALDGLVPDVTLLSDPLGRLSNASIADPSPETRQMAARHLELMEFIVNQRDRYGDASQQLSPKAVSTLAGKHGGPNVFADGDLGLGEFFVKTGADALPARQRPDGTETLGQGDHQTRLSVVLEGGGGKGFCYVECLRQLKSALAGSQDGQFVIDEYAGTSAGAISAGLLAAGLPLEDLTAVLQELDFKKFFGDYMQNAGGTDPKIRSLNQAGMFSAQAMYRTLHGVLSEKLGLEGRPILFRDLPYKLKVTTAVLNTDLPENHPLRQAIGPDGQLVLSSETTPNFDVVAAMVASSCIPGVFNPIQILVGSDVHQGQLQTPYRLQLMDGGTVNNFPIMSATREGQTGLAVLPAHYGELSTLDFNAEPAKMGRVNDTNRENYERFMPGLVTTMNTARYDRFVVGLNLTTPDEQMDPVVQGATRAQSESLIELAHASGAPVMDAEAGAAVVAGQLPGASLKGKLALKAVNGLLDDRRNVISGQGYRPPTDEATGLGDVLLGAAGAGLIAGQHASEKLFEG